MSISRPGPARVPTGRLVKRTIIFAGAIVAVALATVAVATTRTYSGKLEGGGTDSFAVRVKHRTPVKVLGSRRGWAWRNVPISCAAGGDTTASGHFTFPMRVNDRGRFIGNGYSATASATVRGRFSRRHHGRIASGSFRLQGIFGGHSGCDTGRVTWHARH